MTTKLKQQAIGNIDATSVNGFSASDLMPIGTILPFAGSTAPSQFLMCGGQAISRTTYADLFSVIGTTYGVGDGSSTFNLPNLEGRVPVGKSSETEFSGLGQTGGAKTHTLTVSEMPSHNHTTLVNTAYTMAASAGVSSYQVQAVGTTPTGNTGGGQAHNNLQPYLTINYIIRY